MRSELFRKGFEGKMGTEMILQVGKEYFRSN